MATQPLSIRFDPALLDRLRRRAAVTATSPSGLAQRLVDEGLRSQEFPGIIFRDGPSGRRAALTRGLDVWEIVAALADTQPRGEAAISAVAEEFGLAAGQVRTALAYYGTFPDEIDAQIAENERAEEEGRRAWESQRRLLA